MISCTHIHSFGIKVPQERQFHEDRISSEMELCMQTLGRVPLGITPSGSEAEGEVGLWSVTPVAQPISWGALELG